MAEKKPLPQHHIVAEVNGVEAVIHLNEQMYDDLLERIADRAWASMHGSYRVQAHRRQKAKAAAAQAPTAEVVPLRAVG